MTLQANSLPLDNLNLYAVLKSNFEDVDRVIKKARENVDSLAFQKIVDVGQIIKNANENLKVLNKDTQVKKASSLVQEALWKINKITEEFRTSPVDQLEDLKKRTLAVIKSMPFMKKPILESSEVKLKDSSRPLGKYVRVRFSGNFEVDRQEGIYPTLAIAGTSCDLLELRSKELTFGIPLKILEKHSSKEGTAFLDNCLLTIPYLDKGWFWDTNVEAKYRIALNVLSGPEFETEDSKSGSGPILWLLLLAGVFVFGGSSSSEGPPSKRLKGV